MSPRLVHAVRSDGFAGVERYICDVVNELVARGWQVTVVGGDPQRMRQELADGCEHRPAARSGAVAAALVGIPADLVHTHMTAADVVAACTTVGPRRPALVTTRHFVSRRGRRPALRPLVELLIRRYDVRLATSAYVAGADPAAGEQVLLSGVPDQHVVPLADRRQTVVLVQRHEPEKQTDFGMRAWAASKLPGSGWRLQLAGRGSATSSLEALAEELGIAGSVDVLGFVSPVQPLLASAGALLATTPAEAFGLAVVEAMSFGTPVIATAAGGHLETLGAGGWTFDVGDVEACVRLLDRLTEGEQAVEQYSQYLWRRQRSELSISGHVSGLEQHYRRALQRRGRAVPA